MSGERVALVAGATGLVGAALVRRLAAHPAFERVIPLVRRAGTPPPPGVTSRVVDFARLDDEPVVEATDAFCALGTTIAKAGSQEAFRRVDYDAVVAFARYARRCWAERALLVSSVGADARASGFYLRVKGEVEQAVAAIGFPSLLIVRPSLLLGDRQESRPLEAVARALAPVFNPLLRGPLSRYAAVPAGVVAAALVAGALEDARGTRVWEHDEIARAAATTSPEAAG
jgi:uncharacterized protein YbjT (DUF2867 family)